MWKGRIIRKYKEKVQHQGLMEADGSVCVCLSMCVGGVDTQATYGGACESLQFWVFSQFWSVYSEFQRGVVLSWKSYQSPLPYFLLGVCFNGSTNSQISLLTIQGSWQLSTNMLQAVGVNFRAKQFELPTLPWQITSSVSKDLQNPDKRGSDCSAFVIAGELFRLMKAKVSRRERLHIKLFSGAKNNRSSRKSGANISSWVH